MWNGQGTMESTMCENINDRRSTRAATMSMAGASHPYRITTTRNADMAVMSVIRSLSAAAGLLTMVAVPAQSADELKRPIDYRNWFHVNTMIVDKPSKLFAVLGGMHNVHVNSMGEAALRTGGPYPNGTMFVIDLHDFSADAGTYVEGPLKGVALMEKDSNKYAATGGWGFQFWLGGDPKKPAVTNATKQCFECHQPKKEQDYVYSTYIP
jgi:hypothetical protein